MEEVFGGERSVSGWPAFLATHVLEISWITTTPKKDGDELDDDHSYDGWIAEGCCATLKDACRDRREDLPSAICTLISGVRTLQSGWTCTGFDHYFIN
ncbi:hypothetical protein U9M48_013786, partial [Paspalum notatum var. saurae]